jgi:hypothetical protein
MYALMSALMATLPTSEPLGHWKAKIARLGSISIRSLSFRVGLSAIKGWHSVGLSVGFAQNWPRLHTIVLLYPFHEAARINL